MTNDIDEFSSIYGKWEAEWEKNRVHNAEPEPGRKKFFVTAAFPYPNSPPHIGHGRTYVTADVLARYKRSRGYNVLFPMGFHFTGTPIITMADDIAKGDKELIDIFENLYKIPKDVIPKLADPLYMANYFKGEFERGFRKLGLSIDWRREFTSINPEFSAMVVWQFSKLKGKNFIVTGEHPVGWCPIHNTPVGMHDTKSDVEPEIGEFTVIFFQSEDGVFPVATLRPETIFGATNLWINPKEDYIKVEVDGSNWWISRKAFQRLSFQMNMKETGVALKGAELVGREVMNPVTGNKVKVIGASFVDPKTATGVVMSVPAHAPFDYYYLLKEGKNVNPIPVIEVNSLGEIPAKKIVEDKKPKNDEQLEEATKELYRLEFNTGKMRKDLGKLVNGNTELTSMIAEQPVPKARDVVKKFILEKGLGTKVLEIMNRPVYCRCGNEIVVHVVKDQWFIDYGNAEWKKTAKEYLSAMQIFPQEARKEFEAVFDWLDRRACARTRGLGTPFPWDRKWIIESLSDSTIYMAFYCVAHIIKENEIRASQLSQSLWDYVFLGIGDPVKVSEENKIDRQLLERMRDEFVYWYPLDSRHSGKDLIANHLSFFVFNHVAVFPRELWPKSIVVNGFILYEGKKMSKSLRNIVPLEQAIKKYGPDTVRLVLVGVADLWSDANFTDDLAKSINSKLKKIYQSAKEGLDTNRKRYCTLQDKWLSSIVKKTVKKVSDEMETLDFRGAVNDAFFMMERYYDEYLEWVRSVGQEPNQEVIREFFENLAIMLSPFAPYISEEIWHLYGGQGFVINAKWPENKEYDVNVLLIKYYIDSVISDIQSIMEIKKGKTAKLTFSDNMKLLRTCINSLEKGGGFKEFVREVVKEERIDVKALQRLYDVVTQLEPEFRKFLLENEFNEYNIIRDNLEFIKRRTGMDKIEISEGTNLTGKVAIPLRPAILLE
ncbi:leucine--tRNA ligase [Sulfolobales archaeon HS-7]|nr:leucine--tRNA ligase [Sulfolobales archaeon HS-7]